MRTHFIEAFVRIQDEEEKNEQISMSFITEDVNQSTLKDICSYPKGSPELLKLIQEAFDNKLIISQDLNLQRSVILSRIFRYLLNIRVIGVILANIFWNQIKYLIRERVQYDRDLFNYEEYRQIGLSDKRLIKNTLFMES